MPTMSASRGLGLGDLRPARAAVCEDVLSVRSEDIDRLRNNARSTEVGGLLGFDGRGRGDGGGGRKRVGLAGDDGLVGGVKHGRRKGVEVNWRKTRFGVSEGVVVLNNGALCCLEVGGWGETTFRVLG